MTALVCSHNTWQIYAVPLIQTTVSPSYIKGSELSQLQEATDRVSVNGICSEVLYMLKEAFNNFLWLLRCNQHVSKRILNTLNKCMEGLLSMDMHLTDKQD